MCNRGVWTPSNKKAKMSFGQGDDDRIIAIHESMKATIPGCMYQSLTGIVPFSGILVP